MQDNVCKKFDITRDELKKGIDRFCGLAVGKFAGDINVLLAIVELLTSGDIPEEG